MERRVLKVRKARKTQNNAVRCKKDKFENVSRETILNTNHGTPRRPQGISAKNAQARPLQNQCLIVIYYKGKRREIT